AAVPVRVRPLGRDTVRLRLPRPLPLHLGDRVLLRDPGRHHIAGSAIVLDVAPPALRRRGAAATRATLLAELPDQPDERIELRRRKLIHRDDLVRMGVTVTQQPVCGPWLADPEWWRAARSRLRAQVVDYARTHPLEPMIPVETLRQLLGLPDRALVQALLEPPIVMTEGRVGIPGYGLPEPVRRA